ncbi:MAG: Flp pilus assembly complex ATPase component TadA, partial [Phycisphaerales bacterium]|nr:Flp pilus assembly complex ATPase component TadA [Phycisphaerales bacterium]
AATKRAGTAELEIVASNKMKVRVPDSDTPEYAARLASEAPMLRAMELHAQQVDIGPTGHENQYATSYLIDGVRQAGDAIVGQEAVQVIDFWKQAAGLSVEDRRRRQIGDLTISKGVDKHNVRVTASGTQQGMRFTARFDPSKSVRRAANDLGLTEAQLEALKAIVDEGQGVVLLASQAHSGRTTTLYSVVKMHDAYTRNVQTIEMATEDALEGVKQSIFDPYAEGAEFSMLVRSTLRRDPDVVGICDLPDAQTAKVVAQGDHERTRAYISMRADSALTAIQMWTKAVGDPGLASSCLRGVVAQRLVRRLCTNCRVPYQPPADMLRKLGLKPESVKQLFKEGGQVLIKNKPEVCPVCQGIGYRGQTGLFEVYSIDKAERALIAAGDFAGLRSELRKKRLPSIQQVALLKTVEGVTSINEITRTSGEKKK